MNVFLTPNARGAEAPSVSFRKLVEELPGIL